MRLVYDRYGNMTSEKWYDEDDNPTYEYVYAYDGDGNIVKTIDKGNKKEYNYTYDEGKLIRAIAGIIGNASAKLLSKCVTKHFSSLTKAKQKKFLNSIGRITNRQLHEIRNQANSEITQVLIDKWVKKYGYDVLVSAWVSSTVTELT